MATDATGTPTSPDNLPKLNTSVDSPSGLGMNAMMDAVQTALSARVSIPASLASGEVPVWNGTTWVRSSVTNIGPTSLGSGTPDATKFLRGDGTWQVPASVSGELGRILVSTTQTITVVAEASAVTLFSLPAITFDGSNCILEVFCPYVQPNTAAISTAIFSLWEGGTEIERLGAVQNEVASTNYVAPVSLHIPTTPTAGSHTYTIKGHAITGSWTVGGGSGGVGTYGPAYARVYKA